MTPKKIKLHRKSRVLEIQFDDGTYNLPAEFLRVHSPSAEVRGHGPGQENLPIDKQNVAISDVEPAGTYAIRLIYDDGHESGIYTWQYLYELATNQSQKWQDYLQRAAEKREKQAEKDLAVVKWIDPD